MDIKGVCRDMCKIVRIVAIGLLMALYSIPGASAAWLWGDANTVVTINDEAFSPDDFKHWWALWNEEKNAVPEDPQQFIEWKLVAQEARIMELDQTPTFKRKINVFLKSRSRVQFKYDEVDSRIQPMSEQELKDKYNADYIPIWLVSSLYFDSLEDAEAAHKGVTEGLFTAAELLERKSEDGGPVKVEQNVIRPYNFNKGNNPVAASVEKLEVGEISYPQPLGKGYIILFLKERITDDPVDFNKAKKTVREKTLREKQAELTYELMVRLKKKYDVQIDEELLPKIDVDLTGDILSRPIVTTSNGNIPVFLLVKDLRKEKNYIKGLDAEQLEERKRGLLNGMIMEYLITWESLGRHYEEKSPLKLSYQFYIENRLIKEFENRLVKKQISVTDEEIKEYYDQNIDQYTGHSMVSVALLEDEEELVNKIWGEISIGQDFFIVAKRYFLKTIPVKDVVLEQLSPELAEVVGKLSIGEVSSPFKLGNKYALVKLINLRPAKPQPLARVKKSIGQKLYKEKYNSLRRDYIEKLLAQSDVEVNQRAWARLKKEMAADK